MNVNIMNLIDSSACMHLGTDSVLLILAFIMMLLILRASLLKVFTMSLECHFFYYVSKHLQFYIFSLCLWLAGGKLKKCLTCVLVLVSIILLNIIPLAFVGLLLAKFSII